MKLLIADDHEIVRTGLKRILEHNTSISEIFEVSDGEEALKFISNQKPEVVILDIAMPKLTGLEVLDRLADKDCNSRVLMLSMYPEKEYALRALKSGAYGYITKDSAAEELNLAIQSVLQGHRYVSRELQNVLFDLKPKNLDSAPHELLSDREFKVFLMLAEGKKIKKIAEILFISNKTVSTYKARIFKKMEMQSMAELTRYAIAQKLIM